MLENLFPAHGTDNAELDIRLFFLGLLKHLEERAVLFLVDEHVLVLFSVLVEEGKFSILVHNQELELSFGKDWLVDVVTSWVHFFVLLLGEDVLPGDKHLSMAVFSAFGPGHVVDFAWESLEHDKVSNAQGSNFDWDSF